MEDTELVTMVTLSLRESYEPLVMALQSRRDTITFAIRAGRLLQELGRRQISQTTQSVRSGSDTPQPAFTAQRPTIPRGQRGQGGYTFNGKGRGGFGTKVRGQVLQGTKCHYCGKVGHSKHNCYKRKLEEANGSGTAKTMEFTFLAQDINRQAGMSWIVDSGASQHLSRDRTQFLTYKNVGQPKSTTLADCTKIEAHGMGDIEIPTCAGIIKLTDVWHVPNIGASLILVARMVDAGYTVEFDQEICFVHKAGVKTELGYRNGSLYYLNQDTASPQSHYTNQANLGLVTNQPQMATLETRHRRLCHCALDSTTVRYLSSKVSEMKVSNPEEGTNKICGVCAQGRQHKEAQTGVRERAIKILAVVHTDICGPMQTPGLDGEKCYITFTDGMSGRVNICLLHSKGGVLTAFETYRVRAEKACGRELKALRSDGGGEYINTRFQKYLQDAGIKHIVSTPYSLSQNGRGAERMNRTIMEMFRGLGQKAFYWRPEPSNNSCHLDNTSKAVEEGNYHPFLSICYCLPCSFDFFLQRSVMVLG